MQKNASPVPLSLALQGGGAHGAYTWGVLDALLESGRVEVAALSGASAGTMNALVLSHGLLAGGPDGAREALAKFWEAMASQLPMEWFTQWISGPEGSHPTLSTPAWLMMQWAQYLGPAQINPMQLDPLRDVLQAQVDFERLRQPDAPRLFIAATQARTGRLRLFDNSDVSIDAALASACLPSLRPAVVIDGEPYWDGGYSANPALFPLVRSSVARDCLIVMLSPMHYAQAPQTSADIRARSAEFAFNATFLREARLLGEASAAVQRRPWPWRWLLRGTLEQRLPGLRFHLIDAQADLGHLPPQTKLLAHAAFVQRLHGLGRTRAQAWLAGPGRALGHSSSVDLLQTFGCAGGDPCVAPLPRLGGAVLGG